MFFHRPWSIKNIVEIATNRRNNKLDCNICFSGGRGVGKSTLCYRFFVRFDAFKPWEHIVYSRPEVIRLITAQKYGYIMDDEAIASSYKRDFQNQEQQELIKVLNMYRDNFNVYGVCIPDFYSLDKDIRKLIKIHINVISRGVAVVHKAKEGRVYADDPWDIEYNKKIEQNWNKYRKYHPDFKPSYHKLSTFIGYLYFSDMTPNQRELYEQIKKTKRDALYAKERYEVEVARKNKLDEIYNNYKNHVVNDEWLKKYCEIENVEFANILRSLRERAKEENITLSDIKKEHKEMEKKAKLMSGGIKVSDLI
jgi:hypothetical protein